VSRARDGLSRLGNVRRQCTTSSKLQAPRPYRPVGFVESPSFLKFPFILPFCHSPSVIHNMVFFFKSRCGEYTIYMGRDKFENEDLIKYGLPEDVWFHVDDLSSAHVYLRMKPNMSLDDISEDLLLDCSSLVKANSIEGCKVRVSAPPPEKTQKNGYWVHSKTFVVSRKPTSSRSTCFVLSFYSPPTPCMAHRLMVYLYMFVCLSNSLELSLF
jgi:NFACT protein RNA binding domain